MNRRQVELDPKQLDAELEAFKMFARAKLNLGIVTVYNYTSKIRAFLSDRSVVTDRDVQSFIQEKKESCSLDYVSNIISALKAYFRDFKGLTIMDGYRHPSSPLKVKAEVEPAKVKRFIEAIESLQVRSIALLLATSGLRKGEVLGLRKTDIDRDVRCIIPSCHTGETKHSGISFYAEEAETALREYEQSQTVKQKESVKLFLIGHETFIHTWKRAREKSGVCLKPKDLRDFFSQEMGKALIPDRFIDVFQGRAPKNVLAKHYTPQGIRLLKEIYEKAELRVLRTP